MTKRSRPWVRILVALSALGALGYAFFQSVQSTRAEPYRIDGQRLRNWTLAADTPQSPSDPLLSLRPPPEIASSLFRQIFARHAESMSGPAVPAMPLLLQDEFDRAFARHSSAAALLAMAEKAGLASAVLAPRCMAYRRDSAPGVTRQLYFVLFEVPAFTAFRDELGKLAEAAGRPGVFDPAALSPVLIIAASDPGYARWLPLRANPEQDCVAAIES